MSKIVKVSQSDYRLKVRDSGNITLDTGSNVGTVYVTGNLEVQGTTTTIDTANLTIEDNIILLNKGEPGAGVTEVTSGLQIDRGSLDDAQLVWDESVDKFRFQTITDVGVGTLSNIVVGTIATDPASNLRFDMQSGAGTLRVINSTDYEARVLDDDDIPNRKYVSDYVYASGGAAVVDKIRYPVTAPIGLQDTSVEAGVSSVRFYVKTTGVLQQRAQVTASGLDVDNVNIFGDTIRNSTTADLVLTSLNNHVYIDGYLNLDERSAAPSATGGASRIYSNVGASTYTPGDTGIYFTNNLNTGELVAKNRALLFSILF
jgi:hypothetical protein